VQGAVVSADVLLEGSREAQEVVAGRSLSKTVREGVTLPMLNVRSYSFCEVTEKRLVDNLTEHSRGDQ
jgi:hypothetical protein